ncbi:MULTISPECIES: GNAT family N-acetyltransferase [unclassified Shinella]|uniref:GNAT family N-acetyltransferase n=1 Tax=unclassified Shinella TaxID=2643062 RepID=UPI00225D0FA7|nr:MULTISPECIES: GNAT family N-acetyltransferase [unclassified Shinella]MCO5140484.1 GNAT family N-acetyltransferase [Shinella sp.]MDC7254793.1 GNAT family N-acetyltransferase [Shinella sp. YE25]CAI0337533.1 Acetyltransferase [Rhizobiaceae bacterium]CAK7256019.1 Acetyltransferase [Shinella sp. WSC3-e]
MAKKSQPAPIAVHVTTLEMTAPPKQSLPVPVNVQTAILNAPDIPLAFYRFLYRQVGGRWHWVDRLRMDDATLAATLHDKRNSVTVLYVNGAPAGFFELLQVDDAVVELSHFGLFERALGLGIGKWFLLQTLYAAWALGPKRVTVDTNNLDHPRALQLYQMFGFSPVGTKDTELVPLSDAELLALAKRDCLPPSEPR